MFRKKKIKPEAKTYEQLVEFANLKEDTGTSKEESLKRVFEFANSCRDKEIDRFWSRGTYFWAFIAASFAAYMAVFNSALATNENGIKVALSLNTILDMSFTAKIALFVLSFICFIFCFSWLLVHKGSKFWQENWETHISYLENDYMGKIYKSYLDTKNYLEFNKSILSVKAYKYSVSKISLLCSLLLTFCSLGLSLFHAILFFLEKDSKEIFYLKRNDFFISIAIIILAIIFIIFYCINASGKKLKKNDEKSEKSVKNKTDNKNQEDYSDNYNYFSSINKTGKRVIIKIKKENCGG